MSRETKKQTTDEHLFQQEMQDVVPLRTPPRTGSRTPRESLRKRAQQTAEPPERIAGIPSTTMTEQAGSHDASSHRKTGVQARLLVKLKRGQFPPGDQLDLHHETVVAAHAMLQDFIAHARYSDLKSVRIIHGKGLRSKAGPVLKSMVHKALREHPDVLAFTSCKPAHGGGGAVDVLLKRS
jgi:DNA-nicking Smr family endonuclease